MELICLCIYSVTFECPSVDVRGNMSGGTFAASEGDVVEQLDESYEEDIDEQDDGEDLDDMFAKRCTYSIYLW